MEKTIEETALVELIDRYKTDVESVYNTWNEQRGRGRRRTGSEEERGRESLI